MSRDLCESAKKGRLCIDDLCRGSDVSLCGFDLEAYQELVDEDDNTEPDYFDCAMDRTGACGKAGSEECDFECPYMAEQIASERRNNAKAGQQQAGSKGR